MPNTQPSAFDNQSDGQHLVLVGNGDSHLHIAAHAERLIRHGARVTLVTQQDFAFSDWLGGMLGGEWQHEDVRLPADRIVAHGGAHVRAEVTRVERQKRRITLGGGQQLDYDWLSLDLPPVVDEHAIPGFYHAKGVFTPAPDDLWQLRQQLETRLASATGTLPAIAVIGGGPTGVELAANLLALGERYGRRLPVALIGNDRRPLPGACQRANRWLTQRLLRRGLRLELVATAARYDRHQLILDDGSAVDADLLLVTDHLRPSPTQALFDLTPDEAGHFDVDTMLRSREDSRLFLARETPPAHDRPLTTRERAALLLESLDQTLSGESRTLRHDQFERWKALNLGDLRDIAWRGPLWCRGRWVRRWKHRRDRREVAHYLGNA
ncbi:FAD-dependent oxidoreductase [Salinicola salarius]|uniref:FAD-dependent oxidoreductase n=1 Tax=Salinicola salarius TaxID=430457 RepID=UPI0023E4322F|nr:FAD-dependent oxidoreductase [Salinicola salarius]MDF3919412.1 FAD-dependent oxidoreductase [Salinicola salarius]